MALSIATYNVLDLFEPIPDDAPAAARYMSKLDFLARKIRELDADVIGLQEVGSDESLRALSERLEAPYARVIGTPDQRGIRCALLSRLPIIGAEVHTAAALPFPVFVQGDPAPYGERLPLRRGIVHAELQVPATGEHVHVLVVHFKSGRPAPLRTPVGEEIAPTTSHAAMEGVVRSMVFRAAEALFVRKVVDDICAASPEARVAVVGDFNDVYGSIVVRSIRGFGASELFDATRSVPYERRHTLVHFGISRAIDHILVSGPLFNRVAGAEVKNEDLRDHDTLRSAGELFFHDSDHAPVVARFST